MAPVARHRNRCNYVWKFLIHPIMFDKSPAFHVNCQRFAVHGPILACAIAQVVVAQTKFANERASAQRKNQQKAQSINS